MGRPRRRTGHLAGTFAPPLIISSQNQTQRGLATSKPLYKQSPLPQFPIPFRPQNSASESPQYSTLPVVETTYTPSTTDALSPISRRATLSPSSSSVTSGYTVALEHVRHLSPSVHTPTSSTPSVSNHQRLHRSDHANEQVVYPTAIRPDYSLASGYPMTEGLVGIDSGASLQETSTHLYQNPQFITPQGPSPTGHQRYPVTAEPWSGLPFRHEEQHVNGGSSPPIIMEIVQETPRSPHGRERGGGRTGPLSLAQRQQASDVRKRGACLRCTIMREKCESSYPCTTCKTKERRKFPKHCISRDFEWERHKPSLFPDALTCRLRNENVLQHLASSTFALSHRSQFTIPLDMHIGSYLYVTVKEFCPLESAREVRHAFHSIQGTDGKRTFARQEHWNPPIVMLIGQGGADKIVRNMQKSLVDIFDQVLDDPNKFEKWTTQYFEDAVEDFQTTILGLLGEYYERGLKEHAILRTCLKLLWFEYLLLNKFTIPPDAVSLLEANLDSERPIPAHKNMHVIPDTINRFLKAIILPMAEAAAEEVTRHLHDLLFKMALTQTQSKASSDLALCLLFGLMIYLGRTHNALLLLAHTPPNEIGEPYTVNEARSKIRDMEDKVSDYFLSFHKYALSRRSKAPMTSTEVSSPAERHAKDFDLVGHLRKDIEEEYESERPKSLSVIDFQMDTFRYMNVRRLCWKVFVNIEESRC